MALMIEGGYMAKEIRQKKLRKKTVLRHFAMKWSTSARVENLLIRKANWGLLIRVCSRSS